MGLQQDMLAEEVRQLSLREPVTASPGTSLREAVTKMRAGRLGCAIVVDDDRKPLGIFTENLLTQLLTQDAAALDDPVEKHMASPCPWVRLTDPIYDVLDAMESKNIRFLCVLDDEGRLTGLTGQKGIIEYVADHFPNQVLAQRIGGRAAPEVREGA